MSRRFHSILTATLVFQRRSMAFLRSSSRLLPHGTSTAFQGAHIAISVRTLSYHTALWETLLRCYGNLKVIPLCSY